MPTTSLLFPTFKSVVAELRSVDHFAEDLVKIAQQTIKHLNNPQEERETSQAMQELELNWYQSLHEGNPDYSVYGLDLYNAELLACFWKYSRNYILEIFKNGLWTDGETILDLGCGLGLTCALLKNLMPKSTVIGTNIPGTYQYTICEKLSKKYGFELRESSKGLEPITIFASEYFEHFQKPVEHLEEVLETHPIRLFIANTFGSKSIGHFDRYEIFGQDRDGEETARLFNTRLRIAKYESIKTRFWNQRPTYWLATTPDQGSLW